MRYGNIFATSGCKHTGSTLPFRCDSSAAVSSAWESRVSAGVTQPNICGVPVSSSEEKREAHICRSESENEAKP